jgi:hypothetical protein
MVVGGLVGETAGLLASGRMAVDSMAARAIGYRQAAEYLTREAPTGQGEAHEAAPTGQGEAHEAPRPGSGAAAEAGPRSGAADDTGNVAAFEAFFVKFGTATRNYATQQIKVQGRALALDRWNSVVNLHTISRNVNS